MVSSAYSIGMTPVAYKYNVKKHQDNLVDTVAGILIGKDSGNYDVARTDLESTLSRMIYWQTRDVPRNLRAIVSLRTEKKVSTLTIKDYAGLVPPAAEELTGLGLEQLLELYKKGDVLQCISEESGMVPGFYFVKGYKDGKYGLVHLDWNLSDIKADASKVNGQDYFRLADSLELEGKFKKKDLLELASEYIGKTN